MELMKMSEFPIPTCCGFALEDELSIPGKEYVVQLATLITKN